MLAYFGGQPGRQEGVLGPSGAQEGRDRDGQAWGLSGQGWGAMGAIGEPLPMDHPEIIHPDSPTDHPESSTLTRPRIILNHSQ